MNLPRFTQSVQALPFLPCTRGSCRGSSCENFVRHIQGQIPKLLRRPAYSPTWRKKKKENGKKSGMETGGKGGGGGGKVLAENDVTCDESSCELRRIVHRENTVNRCHTKSNTVIQLFSLIFKTSRLILNIVARLSKVSLHVLSKRNLSIG